MESGCSCDVYDDGDVMEPCEIRNIRRSRKEHTCIECGEAIPIGSPYERIRGLIGGFGWETSITCTPCASIRKNYGCGVGTLRDDIEYCLGFDYVTGKET